VPYSKAELDWAVAQGIITGEQKEALIEALDARQSTEPRFDYVHVAYYFGALVVISAMGWFMTEAWERFGGLGITLIALGYAAGFLAVGHRLWHRSLRVPGGLLITLAVWMTPLVVYGIEKHYGLWPQGSPGIFHDYHPWIRASWLVMEAATVLTGALALRFYRFTFLTFPIAFSAWYMSMDLTPLIMGRDEFDWNERLWVSLVAGLLILLVAYIIDRRTKQDYAFWLYLFGMAAFWGGLSLMKGGDELAKAMYGLINVVLIALSVLLQRRIFIICGALGILGYLGHLSHVVFKDSLMFPFALSALGLIIIYAGIMYQRHRLAIEKAVLGALPNWLIDISPVNRGK
jgi:hypothetical protein